MSYKIKTLQVSANSLQGTSKVFQSMTPFHSRHRVNNNTTHNAGTVPAAHKHGAGTAYIALNHIHNAPAAVKTALHHRVTVTERNGCQVVALDDVFTLLAAALLEVEVAQ